MISDVESDAKTKHSQSQYVMKTLVLLIPSWVNRACTIPTRYLSNYDHLYKLRLKHIFFETVHQCKIYLIEACVTHEADNLFSLFEVPSTTAYSHIYICPSLIIWGVLLAYARVFFTSGISTFTTHI